MLMASKIRRATGIMFWSPQREYSPGEKHGGQRNPRVTPQHGQEEQRTRWWRNRKRETSEVSANSGQFSWA